MKLNIFFGVIFNLFVMQIVFSQTKKNIDFDAIDKWTYVQNPSISSDGNYTVCILKNEPLGRQTLLVQAIGSTWKQQLISKDFGYGLTFSADSRYGIFNLGNDSLGIIHLGTPETEYIPSVSSFTIPGKGNSPYIIYDLKESPKKSVVYNLKTREKTYIPECESLMLSPDGQHLVTQSVKLIDSVKHYTVNWHDLKSKKEKPIWEGSEARDFIFTESGDKLAFITDDPHNTDSKTRGNLVYMFSFERGAQQAGIICNSKLLPNFDSYSIKSLESFSRDGLRLYFKCAERKTKLPVSSSKAEVDVWSFNDTKIKADARGPNGDVLSVIHLSDKKIYLLTLPSEDYWGFDTEKSDFSGKYILAKSNESGIINEDYWNQADLSTLAIISTINGERKVIGSNLKSSVINSYKLSPNGKYILYYDPQTNDYYSYSINNGIRINLTRGIQAEWYLAFLKVQEKQGIHSRGIVGWIENSNDVLLLEKYDIWRVSLDGSKMPVCITNKYGQKYHIEFFPPKFSGNGKKILDEGSEIILSAFNSVDKKNGFYAANVKGNHTDPKQLVMDDYNYFIPWTQGMIEPLKAQNATAWIVGKQRYNESPNFYYTKDFINFKALTNIHPEKLYNWLTAELVNWKLPDSTTSQGILYKPENFDPGKKYPVIFQYYEELSNGLNVFLKPERSICTINIPYYVSNGYLVFTPDIKRTQAGAGQDALNTMVSAAKYLSTFSYVDAKRLGLCGHSMGGYKTNFIVAHTDLFAAANPSSGISNISSWGLGLRAGGAVQGQIEIGQFYNGFSIVERPDLYVKNSPIFLIKNIRTPLLMMYNKLDDYTWIDGMAMFNGLRRAGKRVWMLQYDKHGHFLDDSDTIATTDLTIRQKQFFDHYLMGQSAPKWMTHGIPTEMKQAIDGFELDAEIKTPVGRLLTPEAKKWQEDAEKLGPFTFTIR